MSSTTETRFDLNGFMKWYANRHYEIDPEVKVIYYLPKNAPPREIRFLEVNGLISEMTPLEPIDFGVDTGGESAHTLNVLDVTPSQWKRIQAGVLPLPNGWSLEDFQKLPRPKKR